MKPHAIGHTHRPLPTRHVTIADDGDSADEEEEEEGEVKEKEDGDDGARTKEKSLILIHSCCSERERDGRSSVFLSLIFMESISTFFSFQHFKIFCLRRL